MKKNRENQPIIIIKVNPEDLRYKSDEEINSMSDRLNKNLRIARSKRDFESSKKIEKEICYIQNEVNLRDTRKKRHSRFLSRKWCKTLLVVV